MTPPQPSPSPGAPPPADPLSHEVDTLLDLVRQRYGSRLTAAELDDVRRSIRGIVEGARALRAVRLSNADEPAQPFTPYRAEP